MKEGWQPSATPTTTRRLQELRPWFSTRQAPSRQCFVQATVGTTDSTSAPFRIVTLGSTRTSTSAHLGVHGYSSTLVPSSTVIATTARQANHSTANCR